MEAPVEDRMARVYQRLANMVTIVGVRRDDAQRAINNGNWNERREAALIKLEEFVTEFEKLLK